MRLDELRQKGVRKATKKGARRRRANGFDVLICPAREDGFQETVLGENRWYAIRLNPKKIPLIRYIAFYRTRPVSAITHLATVADIKPYKKTGKYVVNFKGKVRRLQRPVHLGSKRAAPQGPFFSRRKAVRAARTLDDL